MFIGTASAFIVQHLYARPMKLTSDFLINLLQLPLPETEDVVRLTSEAIKDVRNTCLPIVHFNNIEPCFLFEPF